MFAIEVALLTGRYVATAFDDRSRAEWPPHPARLFSALVAACFEPLDPAEDERAALRWLEQQGAPEITAPEASPRDVVTVFVPVNDTSVLGSLDDELSALDAARAEVDAARAQGAKQLAAAEKKLAKAAERLAEATRRAIAPLPAGKEGKEGPAKAASLLPERRTRQPRTFPSVTPEARAGETPRVVFTWPDAAPSPAQRATLAGIAARVARLGHSSSLVSMRISDERTEPTWIPARDARDRRVREAREERVLRVVGPGQLEALCDAFARQADVPGRTLPASFQRYVRPAAPAAAPLPAPVLGEDWIVLRRVDGPRLPSTRGAALARTLRKTLMEAYEPNAPEILTGHRPSGAPSERAHLAFVPLPFVGHERADGAILGAALVLPRDAGEEERRAVFQALDRWERRMRRDDEDAPRLPVYLGRAGELGLARVDGEAQLATLRASTWCAPSATWASATPVALDRNPGDLRSADAKKEAAAYAEAEAAVALACERIGLPRPSRVTVTPAAPLAGGDKVRLFPPFSTGNPPVQRVLVHATLAFAEKVRGPIVLGAGRFFGLGLLRPVGDHG